MSDAPNTPKKKGVGKRPIPRAWLAETRAAYLRGEPPVEMQERLAVKFDVTPRTIRNYVKVVKAQLAKHESKDVEAARARAEQMLLHAYAVAESMQGHTMAGVAYPDPDVKSMVAAAKELAAVHGAVGPQKVELTGKGGKPLAATIFIPAEEPTT